VDAFDASDNKGKEIQLCVSAWVCSEGRMVVDLSESRMAYSVL
jgi:hypothetical protein